MTDRRVHRLAPLAARRVLVVLLVPAFALQWPRASAGAPASPETGPSDAAAAKFDRAEALYREARYDEAIALLEELVLESPDPILHYNLARAHEAAGHGEAAIAAYQAYLRAEPGALDRDAVERRIAGQRARAAEVAQAEAPGRVVERPLARPTPPAPRRMVAPWVLAGVGGSGLIAAAVLGGLARSRRDHAVDAATQVAAARELADARRVATAANITFALAGTLALAGVVWGIATLAEQRRRNALARGVRRRAPAR